MSNEHNSKKETKKQIEERIKYFMKLQTNENKKQKNLNRIPNFSDYSTLIDPINIQNDTSKPIFINNLTLIMNNNRIENIKDNIQNGLNNTIKEKPNESTISTQTIKNLNIPLKKSISIPVSKDLAQYTEINLKKKKLEKLQPKFILDNNNIIDVIKKGNKSSTKINQHKYSEHKYTQSEFEILKTEEKVPQKEIEQISNNLSIYNNNIINNYNLIQKKDENINQKNIISVFHFLIYIEKCYRELSDELINNDFKNFDEKLKIACTYINLIKNEKNIISDIFLQDEEDINSFLTKVLF